MSNVVENRRKFIDALRSGDWIQTRFALHTSEGYCCLGVACELSELGDWQSSGSEHPYMSYLGESVSMPSEVMQFYGFTENEAEYLAGMNDDILASFNQIADWIAKEEEEGFFEGAGHVS